MRRFGTSAVVALALAAPAWGSYPLPLAPEGPPPPGGVPLVVAQPGAPAERPPVDWMPPAVSPREGTDPCGYPFDPSYPCQRTRRAVVSHECWARGDWLYWNMRDTPLPPLVVTGSGGAPLAGIPGANSAPLGGSRDLGQFHGVRATVGQWFDPDGELGIEFTGFVFGREGTADQFNGSPTQSVSVPFTGTNGTVGVYDFSFPGRFIGAVSVNTATQLYGAEGTLLHRWFGDGCVSVDSLLGYRYMMLNERLELFGRQQSAGAQGTFGGSALPTNVIVMTTDSFHARTEFHGGQIGARVEARRDMLTVTTFGKLGAGANIQTLRVDGATSAVGFGITRTAPGGVRALPTNIGRATRTEFSFLAESGLELGLQVTKNLSLRVGYNVLFWSDVLRPGSTVDPVLSRTQVPIDPTFNAAVPATRPSTVLRSSDFLAHGLVVGLAVDW